MQNYLPAPNTVRQRASITSPPAPLLPTPPPGSLTYCFDLREHLTKANLDVVGTDRQCDKGCCSISRTPAGRCRSLISGFFNVPAECS